MKPSEEKFPSPQDFPAGPSQVDSDRGQSRQISAFDRTGVERNRDNNPPRLGIPERPCSKKPTATERKPAVVWKGSSRATSDRKVASQNPIKSHKQTPRNKDISRRIVVPEPPQAGTDETPEP